MEGMDEYDMSDNERLRLEEILDLDLEELQVEEEDDDESDEDESHGNLGVAPASGEYTYDTSVVALHSYLGDVEETQNRRAFLDGGAVLTLPLFYLEGVVLFPEATLPLRVTVPNYIAGIERAMKQTDARYTIGVIRAYKDYSRGTIKLSTTGTTAEIRQYKRLEDGSVNVVAKGQQRFRLRRRAWMDVEGAMCGEVNVIKEDLPSRAPRDTVGKIVPLRKSQVTSTVKGTYLCDHLPYEGNDSEGSFEGELSSGERRLHRSAISSWYSSDADDEQMSSDDDDFVQRAGFQEERSPLKSYTRSIYSEYNKDNAGSSLRVGQSPSSALQDCGKVARAKYPICRFHDVSRAFLPSWVYRMYDPFYLALKAADRWSQVVKAPNMDIFVTKPDLLSFQIASKIPISESARQELLEIDGTSYRLRREIELLECFDKLRCKTCEAHIAKRSDMLVMSSDGPLGAYANPHGFVHEVMTLSRVDGIAIRGPPVKEYSWFPRYAWSIGECIGCGTQMGWQLNLPALRMGPHIFVIYSNIIAYEMSPNTCYITPYVTAYVNFMKSLIQSPADVKILREQGILLCDVASNGEMVKVFTDLDTFRTPGVDIFSEVYNDIVSHCSSTAKTWVAELVHSYFESPWTTIALLAAFFILCSTFLQTYYAIHPAN